MQQKLHLVLREVDHVPAVIYLPPGPPLRPAFSIEYDCAQPVIKFPTSDHNSIYLNESILFLSHQKILHYEVRLKSAAYMMVLKFYELTSFLSAMALSYVEGKIDPNKNIP